MKRRLDPQNLYHYILSKVKDKLLYLALPTIQKEDCLDVGGYIFLIWDFEGYVFLTPAHLLSDLKSCQFGGRGDESVLKLNCSDRGKSTYIY